MCRLDGNIERTRRPEDVGGGDGVVFDVQCLFSRKERGCEPDRATTKGGWVEEWMSESADANGSK
jgi:hypothetical protein